MILIIAVLPNSSCVIIGYFVLLSTSSIRLVLGGEVPKLVALNQHESNILAPPADFNFGGFILGLLLGLIGVGLAYIFSDDDAFRRSAWYGFGTWLIIWLLLVAAAGA